MNFNNEMLEAMGDPALQPMVQKMRECFDVVGFGEVMLAKLTAETLGLCNPGVPDGLHVGLMAWVLFGHEPGEFLCAVLRNDLKEACGRADGHSAKALRPIVEWLYNVAPGPSWGSPEEFKAWSAKGGLRGRAN